MVDCKTLAIADTLVHPKCGVISHQPNYTDGIKDAIRVADDKGLFFHVLASECYRASRKERDAYWKEFNKNSETKHGET